MNLGILSLISLFSGLLLFLLGIIFLFYSHGTKVSNYILAAFMFSNGILLIDFFALLTFPSFISSFPIMDHIGSHCYLLLSPLLYLYIVSLCKIDFRLSLRILLHLIPYVVFVGYAAILVFFNNPKSVNFNKNWQLFWFLFKLALHTQIAIYLILSFVQLNKYRKQIKEIYSNLVNINLTWVNLILYLFTIMWSTDLLNFILNKVQISKPWLSEYLLFQSIGINLILCLSLIYKGMQQTASPSAIVSSVKYSQTKLELGDYEKYKKLLNDFIAKEKPYLTPDLNLDDLSKKINIPQKHLSQTIHTCFNLNFNNFINLHRVEEAKRLIEQDIKEKKTLYQILSDAGFNSKSVFNESFKKTTGYTPKEYRKNIKS